MRLSPYNYYQSLLYCLNSSSNISYLTTWRTPVVRMWRNISMRSMRTTRAHFPSVWEKIRPIETLGESDGTNSQVCGHDIAL